MAQDEPPKGKIRGNDYKCLITFWISFKIDSTTNFYYLGTIIVDEVEPDPILAIESWQRDRIRK